MLFFCYLPLITLWFLSITYHLTYSFTIVCFASAVCSNVLFFKTRSFSDSTSCILNLYRSNNCKLVNTSHEWKWNEFYFIHEILKSSNILRLLLTNFEISGIINTSFIFLLLAKIVYYPVPLSALSLCPHLWHVLKWGWRKAGLHCGFSGLLKENGALDLHTLSTQTSFLLPKNTHPDSCHRKESQITHWIWQTVC